MGLRIGMAVTKAQALAPGLIVNDANQNEDMAGLERLALWALQRISPVVASDPPDGLVIDSTGADHLHGGEEAMLSRMVQRFADAGVEARAAIAGSWGAAHAVARNVSRCRHHRASGTGCRNTPAAPHRQTEVGPPASYRTCASSASIALASLWTSHARR